MKENKPKNKIRLTVLKTCGYIAGGVAVFYLFIHLLVWILPSVFASCSGSDCFSSVRHVQAIEGESEVFYLWDNKKATVTNGSVIEGEGEPSETYYEQSETVVVRDSDFVRRNYDYEAEGYEGVIALFTERYVKNSIQAYSIYAMEYDEENQTAYGFFNLYSRTVGCLSGGGNSNASKSVLGVYFSYSAKSKTLTVLQEVKKGCMVACGANGCVYAKDRKFYVKPLNQEPQFLCKNLAYNTSGHVSVDFSQNTFLLFLSHEKLPFKKAESRFLLASYDGIVYLNEKF